MKFFIKYLGFLVVKLLHAFLILNLLNSIMTYFFFLLTWVSEQQITSIPSFEVTGLLQDYIWYNLIIRFMVGIGFILDVIAIAYIIYLLSKIVRIILLKRNKNEKDI